MSIRLYVGNLPKNDVERDELQVVFAEAGDLVSVKVIKDRKTGKCRGFGFVTVETDEQADQIIEKYNGAMFQEMPIKIEKALPKAKGDDEDGEGGESSPPREPRDIPKPTLSVNKVAAATPTASNNPAPTPRRSGGNSGNSGNSGGGNSGGGKKGARKESNKSNNGGSATYTSTSSTESFQPDPRWAGKLAELKDKLAQSGNP
jgi:RNA recognition motif-containing protein